jgi:hypothetical protein
MTRKLKYLHVRREDGAEIWSDTIPQEPGTYLTVEVQMHDGKYWQHTWTATRFGHVVHPPGKGWEQWHWGWPQSGTIEWRRPHNVEGTEW